MFAAAEEIDAQKRQSTVCIGDKEPLRCRIKGEANDRVAFRCLAPGNVLDNGDVALAHETQEDVVGREHNGGESMPVREGGRGSHLHVRDLRVVSAEQRWNSSITAARRLR